MSDTFSAVLTRRDEAREPFLRAMNHAAAMLDNGENVLVSVGPFDDSKTLEQLRYYFGPLLGAISEQVRTPDRWTEDAWHNLLKRKFLGYEIKKERVAGSKRMHVTRRLRSLKDAKQKQMSKYIEEVTAYAITELGVAFAPE